MSERVSLIQEKPHAYDDTNKGERPASLLEWAETSCFRWWYVICFGWIIRVLSLGYKRTLEDKDLDDIPYSDKASTIFDSFTKECHLTNTNIRETIFRTSRNQALLGGILLLPYFITRMAQPLIIRQIFLLIDQPQSLHYQAYLYIVLLLTCSILPPFLFQQAIFRVIRAGLKVRNMLTTLIYMRLLSASASVLHDTNVAQTINLVAIDAAKFADSATYLHFIWEGPLEAITGFVLLWHIIGFIPTLSGYLILLCLIPIQLFFSHQLESIYHLVSKWTDKRIQTLHELLNGCQIIKMYNWEEPMLKRIHSMRQVEAENLRKASHIRAFNISLFFGLLPLISFFTFGSSWFFNYSLKSIDIFTAIAIYGVIRAPVTAFLPIAIEKLIQLRVAIIRIEALIIQLRSHKSSQNSLSSERNSKGSLLIRDASFSWKNNQIVLHSLNVTIPSGSLVSIIGAIGSSKSSFFAALLNEMQPMPGSHIDITGSSFSYVSQSPWIFPDTIRSNILVGRPFNAQRYRNILQACCLDIDLDRLRPSGDLTMISEKGTNLSGGQKARISLARALYIDADIYLLDDPLASVDRKVGQEIYERCIGRHGLLNNKTRLLITHQMQYTSESDQILHLVHGRIQSEMCVTDSKVNKMIENSTNNDLKDLLEFEQSTEDLRPIIEDETAMMGNVSWKVWRYLFNSSITSRYKVVLLIVLLVGAQVMSDTSNILLSFLSKQLSISSDRTPQSVLLCVYMGVTVATLILAVIGSYYFFHVFMNSANSLHDGMVTRLAKTSIRFHESNPHGRILNRASRDQHVVDEILPMSLFDAMQSLLMTIGSIVILVFANRWVLILIVPYLIVALVLRYIYAGTSHQLKRLESMTCSPIYTLITSTFDGLMTIRASKTEDYFLNLLFDRIDANSRSYMNMISASNCFGLIVDLTTNIFCVSTIALTISLHNVLNASLMVLILMYSITIKGYFQWGLRQTIEAQVRMTSIERIHEYTQLAEEQDDSLISKQYLIDTPSDWPHKGSIEFRNYELRYRISLEPALRQINLNIEPKEKIGIIGRTGAGKSSLFQGLFRLVDRSNTGGAILIDNIDINRIRLQQLRSQISIIPQQPVLFSGTLRFNLDPCNQYTDEECWLALEVVQLKKMVYSHANGLLMAIDHQGSNLSTGQCQLVCAARAILKKTKILLIDEATANVDAETDSVIRTMLSENVGDRTILTIAHRLETVMRSDRIIVLDMGQIIKCDHPSKIVQEYQ